MSTVDRFCADGEIDVGSPLCVQDQRAVFTRREAALRV